MTTWRPLLLTCFILQTSWSFAMPLQEYVQLPDSAYSWEEEGNVDHGSYQTHLLSLVSQTWRSPSEVDRSEWSHWLTLIVPKEIRNKTTLLYIASGSNDDGPSLETKLPLATLAEQTGSVVAEIRMVPNQRLTFADDPDSHHAEAGRQEDELVAYTWYRYLEGGEAEWIAQMPMTKSVVRAMDAIQEFGMERLAHEIDNFVLVGASKRGWTVWTTAAVDPRVVGAIPLVIDMLNFKESMVHHYRTYGGWATTLHDYVKIGLERHWHSEQFNELLSMVEPYQLRHLLTMPKYIINAAGDEFFLPDSSQFYYDELAGEKYLRYIPNTGHRLSDSNVAQSIAAFYSAFLRGELLPNYRWNLDSEGTLLVESDRPPTRATLWQATNPEQRDFRLVTIGQAWKPTPLKADGEERFSVKVEEPGRGWTAYFVELAYSLEDGSEIEFTTQVYVTPEELPYEFHLTP